MSLIKKNFLFNILLNVTNLLFPIISFPYVARVLGAEGLGEVQFIVNFTQYFIVFAALGIPIYGIREIAKNKDNYRKVFSELLTINFFAVLGFYILYMLIILFMPFADTNRELYIYGGLAILFSFSNVDWFYSGLERFKTIALRSLIVKLICLFMLFFLVQDNKDTKGYLLVCIFASVLNNIWNIVHCFHVFKFSFVKYSELKRHIRILFLIFFSVISTTIYNLIDVFFLGVFDTYRAVGLYSAASKIPKLFIPVLTSLGTVLVPSLSAHFSVQNKSDVTKLIGLSFRVVILLGVPITFGTFILSDQIISIFSGADFLEASHTLKLLCPLILLYGISNIYAVQILTPSANDRMVTISVSLGLFISILMNIVLINLFSFDGAAMATLITEFSVLLLFVFFSRQVLKVQFPFGILIKTCLACTLFVPIVFFLQGIFSNDMVIVLSAVFTCFITYFLIQYFVFRNEILHKYIAGKL